jgi:WXG100 family type VII secretion target
MSEVRVDAEELREFSDSLRMYVHSVSEVLMTMRQIYSQLDDEWDDDSKEEFINSYQKTRMVLQSVNEALGNTTHDIREIASIIEQYANI